MDGVPVICPDEAFSVRPAGSVPDVRVHVHGVGPPVAASVCEYATPTLPLLSVVVVIASPGTILKLAVVSPTNGKALAWITFDPIATPVAGTTLILFSGMVTVAGTVATAGFVELTLTVRPSGRCVRRKQ